tara:strand:- start:148 stop:450 length:303 start_codon:yes stop_codon:yes gene_type:complete
MPAKKQTKSDQEAKGEALGVKVEVDTYRAKVKRKRRPKLYEDCTEAEKRQRCKSAVNNHVGQILGVNGESTIDCTKWDRRASELEPPMVLDWTVPEAEEV